MFAYCLLLWLYTKYRKGEACKWKKNWENKVLLLVLLSKKKRKMSKGSTKIQGEDSIKCLQLSTRSYHALRKHRVHTVEQLLRCVKQKELLMIRNVGEKSAKEIYDKVNQIRKD